jgi:hypothetical protein
MGEGEETMTTQPKTPDRIYPKYVDDIAACFDGIPDTNGRVSCCYNVGMIEEIVTKLQADAVAEERSWIEAFRIHIWNLLDDGDEADKNAAYADVRAYETARKGEE